MSTAKLIAQILFPTVPDAGGFFYENADDEKQAIQTKVYENGNKIKQAILPNGKTAVVRELLAKDTKDIGRFMDKDTEKYQVAAIAVATTLNGEKQPLEVIENLKMKDFNILMMMYQDLNF